MIRLAAAMLLTALLAAGCRGDSSVEEGNGAIRIANEHHDNLMKLSPGYQRLTLRRAIHDEARYRSWCREVINGGYQEEYQNLRMWVAECTPDQRRFAIFIAPNGDLQVRNCEDSERLSLPRCKDLPPPVEDPSIPRVEEGASKEAYRQRPALPNSQ